jgi:hypothetical protein
MSLQSMCPTHLKPPGYGFQPFGVICSRVTPFPVKMFTDDRTFSTCQSNRRSDNSENRVKNVRFDRNLHATAAAA